jgi:hypothetical protein
MYNIDNKPKVILDAKLVGNYKRYRLSISSLDDNNNININSNVLNKSKL